MSRCINAINQKCWQWLGTPCKNHRFNFNPLITVIIQKCWQDDSRRLHKTRRQYNARDVDAMTNRLTLGEKGVFVCTYIGSYVCVRGVSRLFLMFLTLDKIMLFDYEWNRFFSVLVRCFGRAVLLISNDRNSRSKFIEYCNYSSQEQGLLLQSPSPISWARTVYSCI